MKYEAGWIELEITEDGLLQMMHGRMSDRINARTVVFEGACLGLVYQMVSLAGVVSEEVGFLGNWDFGVAITGLRGTTSFLRAISINYFHNPIYSEDGFRKTTRAARTEIQARPGAVVERLLGRFMRALGVDQLQQVQDFLGSNVESTPVPAG